MVSSTPCTTENGQLMPRNTREWSARAWPARTWPDYVGHKILKSLLDCRAFPTRQPHSRALHLEPVGFGDLESLKEKL